MKTHQTISISRKLFFRAAAGATVALSFILLLVLGVDNPDPSWPKTWWLRPVIITPLAGAFGGVFFHFMFELAKEGTWKKIFVTLIGIVGYLLATWVGTVLGLVGTMWD